MRKPLEIISLGAGVQSSTMALMASLGELTPMPVAAIFADTGDEPGSVYSWLEWLTPRLAFPVIRARTGAESLAEASTRLRTSKKSGKTYLAPSVPVFSVLNNHKGMMPRQCTREFKVDVVRRATRKLLKDHGASVARMWIGISTDEAHRMKPAPNKNIINIWPLISAGFSRKQCLAWMEARGFPTPPRSACVYCPYHSDAEWLRLKEEEPEAFRSAVAYERKLREAVKHATALDGDVFLHASRRPLDECDFKPDTRQADLFGNECEGMCGV